MEATKFRLTDIIIPILLAAAILAGSTVLAGQIRSSELYNKSRLIRMIFSQDEISLTDIAGNKRNVDMMLKFVGALTSAYIDFELIPVGEFDTFTTVFESIPQSVTIEKFEYHRKNLTITGTAQTQEEYEEFLTSLREQGYFEGVSGHYYTTNEDDIRFELECISRTVSVSLVF